MTKDYSKGKIYRLTCNITGKDYYGSTIQNLSNRRAKHTCQYKRWMEGKSNYTTSFEIIRNGNYNIIWVEDYPCQNKEQLEARERYYIENNECVNKVIPNRSRKEYREINKDKINEKKKVFREKNKDKILSKNKEYYEKNKDDILHKQKAYYNKNIESVKERHKTYRLHNKAKIYEKNKEYRQKNKEKIDEMKKEYRQKNKEKINEKVKCDCGSEVCKSALSKHRKSKKHQDYLTSLSI
jgi:hypothetical protein